MMRILIMLVLCDSVCVGTEPKPLLVVIQRNPWAMVIGSDSPEFALYNDDTLVCLCDPPKEDEPFVTRRISDAKSLHKELVPFDLAKAADHYELSSATDQIRTLIWTPTKTVTIYGNRRRPLTGGADSDPQRKAIAQREKKMWESWPGEIRQTLRRIEEQRKLKGSAWFPEKIEVMFWPYEYAPDESITWPKDWPGLHAQDTRKREQGSFSVYLPPEKLTELRQLLRTRKERGAVLIDGKKMAESYRFPFPGEEAWMK
jgi:hypothetical protein